jgi:hypothetical protein
VVWAATIGRARLLTTSFVNILVNQTLSTQEGIPAFPENFNLNHAI